jgi:multicomponent Na+:H+ antiporter subunit D
MSEVVSDPISTIISAVIYHQPVLLIVIGLVGSFITPVVGFIKKQLCNYWAVLITFTQFCLSLSLFYHAVRYGKISYWLGGWEPPWGIEYVVDILNGFVLVVVSFICFIVSIYGRKSLLKEIEGKEIPLYTLYILLSTGMLGIVVTGDIFNLYVFLEISSLAAYALVAMGDREGLIASFNYMILGTVSACFVLLGVGYLYLMTGTLNMADLSRLLPALYDKPSILIGVSLLIVGFSIKTAIFPLHTWLPDAYTHSPSAISAMLSGTFTKVGVYAIIRLIFSIVGIGYFIEHHNIFVFFSWVAGAGIIFGSLMAIAQEDIKRMLAYSSISQLGYIALGISLANTFSLAGGILHILGHSLMKAGLFMVAGAIVYTKGIRRISELEGLGRVMPFTMSAFLISALSMIGIPPTIGFFSKYYILLGAIQAEAWVFVGIILFSSLLTAVYFWKVFEKVYFGKNDVKGFEEAPKSMIIPTVLLAVLSIVFGFLSPRIVDVIAVWINTALGVFT